MSDREDSVALPMAGTLERLALDLLIERPEGITYLDFPEHLGVTEESLAQIMENLKYGIYPSEKDGHFKFDA